MNGRPISAQDVRNVVPTHGWGAAEIVAEHLNRIARGAPERGGDVEPRGDGDAVGDVVAFQGGVVKWLDQHAQDLCIVTLAVLAMVVAATGYVHFLGGMVLVAWISLLKAIREGQ